MALRDVVLSEVAHEEQMTVWTGEVLGALSVAGFMRDDMAYDEVIEAHRLIAEELREIVGHTVDVLALAARTEGGE